MSYIYILSVIMKKNIKSQKYQRRTSNIYNLLPNHCSFVTIIDLLQSSLFLPFLNISYQDSPSLISLIRERPLKFSSTSYNHGIGEMF